MRYGECLASLKCFEVFSSTQLNEGEIFLCAYWLSVVFRSTELFLYRSYSPPPEKKTQSEKPSRLSLENTVNRVSLTIASLIIRHFILFFKLFFSRILPEILLLEQAQKQKVTFDYDNKKKRSWKQMWRINPSYFRIFIKLNAFWY